MDLPFSPPLEPMLAKLTKEIPGDDGWLFEPKWDGFRAIVFRDGDEVYTQSRDKKPLDRYFPELAEPFRTQLPERCVLDGEIIIMGESGLDFGALQQRIHPAESRINKLAEKTPAAFVAFDLMALGDEDLRSESQQRRRAELERVLADAAPPVLITPATTDHAIAKKWFDELEGAGIEGVIAKKLDRKYEPKKRAMLKIKHSRTADCVVAGFRWHKRGPGELVGSLLLGIYDDEGRLHSVGVTSSFKMAERKSLVAELEPLRQNAAEGHPWVREHSEEGRTPGGQSRWSQGKDHSFEPLRPERVCEVKYDYMQSGRFRHTATFVRWRTDKAVSDCRFDQLEEVAPVDLARVFRS